MDKLVQLNPSFLSQSIDCIYRDIAIRYLAQPLLQKKIQPNYNGQHLHDDFWPYCINAHRHAMLHNRHFQIQQYTHLLLLKHPS